jgi:hypothetical protein
MKKKPGAWPGSLWDKVGNELAAYLYAASSVSAKEETHVTDFGRLDSGPGSLKTLTFFWWLD